MQIRDYDFINNIDVLFERKIVIYGAGSFGRKSAWLLEDAGVEFECFCDKDKNKQQYLKQPIITLDELKKKTEQEEYIIIVASRDYCEGIINDLETKEIAAYICTWYGLQAGIELHIEDERLSYNFRENFIQRKKYYVYNYFMVYVRSVGCISLCSNPHAILVYQPGKVGSVTVQETLRKANIEALHIHSIIPDSKVETLDEMFAAFPNMYKNQGGKIITLVREPIGRALSQFIQTFRDTFILIQIMNNQDIALSASKWMKEKLLDTNQEFLWFDKEIKEVTGIDIFQHPFDRERGYAWIKEGNIEILVLKMEQLSENAAVIGEFVGKPGIELQNSNVGEEKHYKYIYKGLKENIRIPAELLDSQYKDNRQLDHFYTEEEKRRFREKWSKD